MDKNLSVKFNRAMMEWVNREDSDPNEPKGQTDLSKIKNQFDGFRAVDSEALKDIEKDEEFKKAFTKFIKNTLKLQNVGKSSDDYLKIMQEEVEKQKINPDYVINQQAIENARQKFLNHRDLDILRENFDKDTYELEIEKKFPKQMHELKRLMSIGDGERRAKTLMDLGKRFDLEEKVLKKFVAKEYFRKVQEVGEIRDEIDFETQEKMRGVKKFETKKPAENPSSFKTSIESDLRPLSEILSQIVLSGDGTNESQKKELESEYHQVKAFLKQWENSDEQTVRNWARRKKGQLQDSEVLETIAVMDQGNYLLTKGHRLRDPQIVSILVFMKSQENQGKLCQIQTGEGKTVIVSLLVTIKVLQGKQVDVITSNQVLAEEGVTSRKDFFELMGVTVDCNNADENYTRGPRSCYEADVVYGSIGNFQFDYLRHSFEGFQTRGERRFDTVVLDEVDSMLIDNGGYVAKLAGPFPGVETLKYVYLKIWQELVKIVERHIIEDKENLIKELERLQNDPETTEEKIQDKISSFYNNISANHSDAIKAKIKETNPANFHLIPKHLRSYAESCVDVWIGNALYAYFDCHENEKYVIKKKDGEDVVMPVDYQNTGVTLRNTIWSNGLHQFVQLKHNLHLTSETLTTCFISNVGYIKLYKNNMFGLTGTLGSVNEQTMLSKAYNVNYATIPTYKEKKFSEISGMVVSDDHWHNQVTFESILMARQQRSVLIICETIKELQDLAKNIESLKKIENFDELKIRLFPDEDSSNVTEEKVGESEIIIATNIAGRGTDFKTTKELEAAGGLHVIVSFLPVNKRVEDQAFGRTARQGKTGTAQLVIKQSEVTKLGIEMFEDMTFDDVKQKRDDIEKERLHKIENVELAEIDFQDEIFTLFSDLYVEFKEENGDSPFLTKDLKEFWAFWFHKKHYKGKNVKSLNIFDEFESFKISASSILGGSFGRKGKISFNPYYSILETESLLSIHNINEAKEALANATRIAEGHSDVLISIPLKKFEIAMESGRQLTERFNKALKKVLLVDLFTDIEKDEAYKASATVALIEAKKALKLEMDFMRKTIIDEGGSEDFRKIITHGENNILLKHLYSRYLALEAYCSNVESLIEQLDKSGHTIGLAINSKVPTFFKEPENVAEKAIRESITDKELNELSAVGVEYFYGFREVHDVPEEIVRAAQIQISLGIAALTAGIAFPPILPAMGQIAGALISEGIGDIVVELISKGNSGFDATSFVKGKLISYGISIATMGISAIVTSVKMLNFATKACKGLAKVLRSSRYFRKFCEKMAVLCDKFVKHLGKLKALKVAAVGVKMTRTQAFKESLKILARETFEGVTTSVISEKIVTEALERSLEDFKPQVREKVKKIMNERINRTNLKVMKTQAIAELSQKIIVGSYGEIAVEVFKDIALGVLRHSKSKASKIGSMFVDTGISAHEIVTYTSTFCDKFNDQSRTFVKKDAEPASDEIVEESLNMLIDQVTEKVYGLIVGLTGKYANTFVVNPLTSKAFEGIYNKFGKEGKSTNDDIESNKKFSEVLGAFETLGLSPGASQDEINKARKQLLIQNHPDKNRNDPNAVEITQKINEAYDVLKTIIPSAKPPTAQNPKSEVPLKLVTFSNDYPDIVKKDPAMAHKGNIKTLSNTANQHIVVNVHEKNGKIVTKEFGGKFKDNGNETIVLDYHAPSKGAPGHFTATDGIEHQISSGPNNCFFDAYVAVLKSRGIDSDPHEIRKKAEQPSFYNTMYNGINSMIKIFNNPLTRRMYEMSQAGILVGGAGGTKRKHPDPHAVATTGTKKPKLDLTTKKIELSKGSILTVDLNEERKSVFKVSYKILPLAPGKTKDVSFSFPSRIEPDFGGMNVDKKYTTENQNNAFRQLGIPVTVTEKTGFQRGHLAPKRDFYKREEMKATYDFLNAAPMRAAVNNGNFSKLEEKVAKKAETSDVTVTTGTFGKLKIGGKEVYLAPAEPPKPGQPADTNKLSVPNFIYKIIDDGKSKKEAYIVSNNIDDNKASILKDMQNTFGKNLHVIDDNHKKGLAVAIPYEDLKKVIDPVLKDSTLKKGTIELWDDKLKKANPKTKAPVLDYIQHPTEFQVLQVTHKISKTKGKIRDEIDNYQWPNDSIDKFYDRGSQTATFKKLLGKKSSKYENSYLVRGHLAARADFLTFQEQNKTYNFKNTAPMWNDINGGNYVKVENLARKAAKDSGATFDVTVGTLGVLKLEGKEIFLDPSSKPPSIPVPLYIFKRLENGETYIVSNNPFADKADIVKEISKHFGKKWKDMDEANFQDVEKGYTFKMKNKDFDTIMLKYPNGIIP